MTGVRAMGVRRHAVVSAGGAVLLLGLTLPADAMAPPPPPLSTRAQPADTVRPAARQTDAQTATATYACMGRRGKVKLSAARAGGRRIEITMVAEALPSPVTLAAGDVKVTLRLAARRNGHSRIVTFTGTNPRIHKGKPVRVGPLHAKVPEGTRLDSHLGAGHPALELHRGLVGVRCTALSAQRPGPFRF